MNYNYAFSFRCYFFFNVLAFDVPVNLSHLQNCLCPSVFNGVAVAVCQHWNMTSSPKLKFEAKQDKCSPAVQLETVTQYFELINLLISFQKNPYIFHGSTNHF